MNQKLIKAGKIIFALPLMVFAANHFMYAGMMKGLVPAFVPGGIIWVYFIGLCFFAAAVSILINRYTKIASILLAVLLAVFVLTLHLPGVLNPQTMMQSLPSLLKDTSMAGAALIIAGYTKNK